MCPCGGTTNARCTTARAAVGLEHRDERLADLEVGHGGLDVDLGVRPERLGHRLDGLLLARREGAQRVLHLVAELAEHGVRDVDRVLGDEVDAHALAADEAHDLLDLGEQRRRRVGEEQVRLVEEEDELGLGEVAGLGQTLEELATAARAAASSRRAARS